MTKKKEPQPKKIPEQVKMGRPTLYKPEYCEEIIEYARQHKPFQKFCADKLILPSTFNLWKQNNQEFMEATIHARQIMEAWYLEKSNERCEGTNPLGSDKMISFMLSSVYGYREKTDVSMTADVTQKTELKVKFGDR